MSNNTELSVRNAAILADLANKYNEKTGPRIGDWLKMPYGLYTRFTHDWGDTMQTGLGSFHLGKGYISYSGGLDSGLAKSDILPTNELKMGSVWFWKDGLSGADRGFHAEMAFRVFTIKEGADTTGLPKIKEYERNEFLKTVETITRINGNGQEYTLPVPVLRLQFSHPITEDERKAIVAKASLATGLDFELTFHYSQVQPVTVDQVNALKEAFPHTYKFHNGCYFKNTLVFSFGNQNS